MKEQFKKNLLETLGMIAIIGICFVAFIGACTLLILWFKWLFPL